jgi:hypothetical protein
MPRNVNLAILAAMSTADRKQVSEWEFQVAVGKEAQSRGWHVHYTRRTGFKGKNGKWRAMAPAGWPDMFMVRGERAISAELKADYVPAKGTPEQEAWLADLARVPGVETYLWRPRDAESIREVIA